MRGGVLFSRMNTENKTCLACGTGPMALLGAVGNDGASDPHTVIFEFWVWVIVEAHSPTGQLSYQ